MPQQQSTGFMGLSQQLNTDYLDYAERSQRWIQERNAMQEREREAELQQRQYERERANLERELAQREQHFTIERRCLKDKLKIDSIDLDKKTIIVNEKELSFAHLVKGEITTYEQCEEVTKLKMP